MSNNGSDRMRRGRVMVMMFPDGLHNFFSLRQGQHFFGQCLITSATLDLDIHVANLIGLKKESNILASNIA